MTDISRGQRAKELLSDPLLTEAMQGIEELIHEQWELAAEPASRDELWHTLNGAKRFKKYLQIAVDQGIMALHNQEDK